MIETIIPGMDQYSTKSTGGSDWSPTLEEPESPRADDSLIGVCPDKTTGTADRADRVWRQTQFCIGNDTSPRIEGPPYPQAIADADLIDSDTCVVSERVTTAPPTRTRRPPLNYQRKRNQDLVQFQDQYKIDTSKQVSTRKKPRRGDIAPAGKYSEHYSYNSGSPARQQYQPCSSSRYSPAPTACGNTAAENRYYGRFDMAAPWSIVG
ncbi:hypothetical protein QBC37DRAFT_402561 [Rhypophila decipiens]|uniref:Uncharacterized protein n=1 Tax=Rhypophila decipiens TaxID=261697 RepID=A0AAN7B5S6_9PEZI|nr:hypothetical protein QBC37DRAFT_402561 [Rhypophila decipiens]